MAKYTIIDEIIKEYEQEEISEIRQVVGDDGVVVDELYVSQDYCHTWLQLLVEQETFPQENKSIITAKIIGNATFGENGGGGKFYYYAYQSTNGINLIHPDTSRTYYDEPGNNRTNKNVSIIADAGETVSETITSFSSNGWIERGNDQTVRINIYHNPDGSMPNIYFTYKISNCEVTIYNDNNKVVSLSDSKTYTINPTWMPIDKADYPNYASNFTDEENPVINYKVIPTTYDYTGDLETTMKGKTDSAIQMQTAISFDGITPDIAYRDIPVDDTTYTFNLTNKEREVLRTKAQGSTNVPIYYLIKTTRQNTTSLAPIPYEWVSKTERILTIVGCDPQLNPTVKDIKPETLALTGDENTFIRYESMAEYTINATASKNATIVSQSVQCGSKTISNLPYGVIDDVESGTFIFNVVDSRQMGASSSVFKGLVEYVKPTCYQKIEIEITGETGAIIKATISGNYFNGSFGAADNTLQLQVRYGEDADSLSDWITLNGTPRYNGNTYELQATFDNFDYGKAYIFQSRAIDKLNTVQSSQYTIQMLPVFDWSETDFNFNVPVNIEAEDLSMHGETIIRHSNTTNNTVLSASNGNIYIRPGGTNDTSNETIFYGNGNVKFNGTVTFADGTTGGGAADPTDSFADYVIDIGEEAMGSNGTWYWRKWASGKSEAWGCRNFGNMAVTTAWGNLYRSAVLTQDLPDNVFVRTPDSININIVHATFGGWICKHEQTAPSAVTTGSFIFVRPASATVTAPTNIGFYVVGEWQ